MADEREPSGQEGSQGETEKPAEAQVPEVETPTERIGGPAAEPPRGERRSYLLTAGISAAVVVLGAALFVAGFLSHSLLDDDVDLDPVEEDLAMLTEQVGAIHDVLGIAGGDGTAPTPPPVVAASADDDPFIGPEDAPVTIIEFTDYQ